MIDSKSPPVARREGLPASIGGLPAVIPPERVSSPKPPRERRRLPRLLVLAILSCGIAAGSWWWLHQGPALPSGITFSNGRLEADEIDIATKFPGRIAEILVDEGDHVVAGQVVARMDTRDLQASLAQAQAQITQAENVIAQIQAELAANGSQLKLAAQELGRARILVTKGYETKEVLDQRMSQFNAALAAYHGSEAKIAAATAAMAAAMRNADLIRINIDDGTLVAPKSGPIQYRLANVGEVLAPGGKVFTLLDASYVYMDVFLPTDTAGKIKIGDEARIALDALPNRPIPASVSFIASQNQFTPKMVETRSERDKLMFRIRVRVSPELLRQHAAEIRSGLPGLAYIRFDTKAEWPVSLQLRSTQ